MIGTKWNNSARELSPFVTIQDGIPKYTDLLNLRAHIDSFFEIPEQIKDVVPQ
jgi:hypothetical protein